jgi:competence ComEA-like helix-hairpin-helix protein
MRRTSCFSAAVWLSLLIAAPVGAQTTSPSKSPAPAAATAPKAMVQPQAPTGSQEQGGLLDINSASAEELDKLPSVGPARAKAIISHRPYNGKDDVANRKVIPRNVYDQIKDKIIARQKTASGPSSSVGSPPAAATAK